MKRQFDGYSCLSFIFLDCLNCSCFFFELECWRRIVTELRVCAECSDLRWRYKQAAELHIMEAGNKRILQEPRKAAKRSTGSTDWRGDAAVFLPGEGLINAEKQTGCARLRAVARWGRCGTRGTSSCRKEAGRWGWRGQTGAEHGAP